MRIKVDSPHQVIRQGLIMLVGQRHEVVLDDAPADLVLNDLCSYTIPFPAPSSLPTLALICGGDGESVAVEVLRTGYLGYIRAEDGEERMEQAFQALFRGEIWAERIVIAAFLEQRHAPSLTQRESEIYALVVKGLSNREVAQQLGLSINTVKSHTSRLLHKLRLKTRRELMVKALPNRLNPKG